MDEAWPRGPAVGFFSFFVSVSPSQPLPSQLPHDVTSPLPGNASSLGDGKEKASLFCCLSQQLSQGPRLQARRGPRSLIFFNFYFLLACIFLYASKELCVHISQALANMYCVNVHTGDAVTTVEGKG